MMNILAFAVPYFIANQVFSGNEITGWSELQIWDASGQGQVMGCR